MKSRTGSIGLWSWREGSSGEAGKGGWDGMGGGKLETGDIETRFPKPAGEARGRECGMEGQAELSDICQGGQAGG
jgi:hypothetical protein